jgi:glutaredoxin
MSSHSELPDCLLLTRPGCHLCDEADALLRRHGLTPKKVNIDSDAELSGRYTNCVPVVFLDGKRRFTGRVDERLLLRLLPKRS